MSQVKILCLCLFCALLAWCGLAAAQDSNGTPAGDSTNPADRMPAYVPNSPAADGRPGQYYYILGAQAFKNHEYSHAVDMYKVAGSWAYKPAEFNLAVMYARGQGIPVDLPRAMAWMTLAAERNDPSYVKAREVVRSNLDAAQLAESATILQQLTPRYGDEVALRRAKRRWAEVRASMTGSRVGSIAGNMVSGTPKAGPATANPQSSVGQNVPVNGSAATGGQNSDGSVSYQELVSSDNPYDPKFMTPTGTVSVGAIVQVKPAGTDHDSSKSSKTDAGKPQQ